jgi:hypothetical protein
MNLYNTYKTIQIEIHIPLREAVYKIVDAESSDAINHQYSYGTVANSLGIIYSIIIEDNNL